MSEETPVVKKKSVLRKVLFFLKFLEIRLRFIFILIVTALLVGYWDHIQNYYERWQRTHNAAEVTAPETTVESEFQYSCPMHPFVVRDHSGKCPICGMDLVERKKGEATELPEGVLARVQASPNRVIQAGIAVEPAAYRDLVYAIESYGVVAIDETRRARIVARFPGRVDDLMVNAVGMVVRKGDPIARIYSSKFIAAAEEYARAMATARKTDETGRTPEDKAPEDRRRAEQLAIAARKRLELAGFTQEQLDAITRVGAVRDSVTLYSPMAGTVIEKSIVLGDNVEEGTAICTVADLSNLWVEIKLLEADIDFVRKGMPVTITSVAYPGATFDAVVDLVYPTLDTENRTVSVRVAAPNPEGRLKPGMYVTARMTKPAEGKTAPARQTAPETVAESEKAGAPAKIALPTSKQDDANAYVGSLAAGAEYYECPMHAEVVSDKMDDCPLCHMKLEKKKMEAPSTASPNAVLSVPESAVIDTGERKIVYIQAQPGVFDARAVTLGRRAGQFYPVLDGLAAGDEIVTRGAFLIDAEARINPATPKAAP